PEEREKFRKDFRGSPKEGPPARDSSKPEDRTRAPEKDTVDLLPAVMLPYKPLLMMKTALIQADIDKDYTVSARITFEGKEATDEGEHALKTVLYVFRELVVMAPKAEREIRPLAPVAELAQKALKGARIE